MTTDPTSWPEKKLAIIQATIDTLSKSGYEGTTTAVIATRARVGEGTIYRHFRNKADLLDAAASYTSSIIFKNIRENYRADADVRDQFLTYCRDLLTIGDTSPHYYRFIEQYINSPAGIKYRQRIFRELRTNPDIKPHIYPLNKILTDGIRQNKLKQLPLQVLISLTLGPLTYILKHSAQNFLELDTHLIDQIAESCWAAIKAQN